MLQEGGHFHIHLWSFLRISLWAQMQRARRSKILWGQLYPFYWMEMSVHMIKFASFSFTSSLRTVSAVTVFECMFFPISLSAIYIEMPTALLLYSKCNRGLQTGGKRTKEHRRAQLLRENPFSSKKGVTASGSQTQQCERCGFCSPCPYGHLQGSPVHWKLAQPEVSA